MRWAVINGGSVGVPRPEAEKEPGAVAIPDYVNQGDTTPDNGVTWYRGGEPLVPPPITWTALEFHEKFTQSQWRSLRALAENGNEDLKDLRDRLFTAQDVVSSDPRTLAARAALLAVLGEPETIRIFDQP